jgi:hypothetical protein
VAKRGYGGVAARSTLPRSRRFRQTAHRKDAGGV